MEIKQRDFIHYLPHSCHWKAPVPSQHSGNWNRTQPLWRFVYLYIFHFCRKGSRGHHRANSVNSLLTDAQAFLLAFPPPPPNLLRWRPPTGHFLCLAGMTDGRPSTGIGINRTQRSFRERIERPFLSCLRRLSTSHFESSSALTLYVKGKRPEEIMTWLQLAFIRVEQWAWAKSTDVT